jgi:hypothetical protein
MSQLEPEGVTGMTALPAQQASQFQAIDLRKCDLETAPQ